MGDSEGSFVGRLSIEMVLKTGKGGSTKNKHLKRPEYHQYHQQIGEIPIWPCSTYRFVSAF